MSNNDENDTICEQWTCGECGNSELAPIGKLAGKRIEKTVGEGRKEKTITTSICPECESEDWHSKSVSEALLNESTFERLKRAKENN